MDGRPSTSPGPRMVATETIARRRARARLRRGLPRQCKMFVTKSLALARYFEGSLGLDLHREDPGDRLADLGPVDAVERQGELGFHQAVGDAGVVALALDDDAPVLLGVLPEVFLGGGELDLAFFAKIVRD